MIRFLFATYCSKDLRTETFQRKNQSLPQDLSEQHPSRNFFLARWLAKVHRRSATIFLFFDLAEMFLSSSLLQWVADGSPSKSTPIKVESPNQFVPLGTSKKEFKKIQAAVS